MSIKITLPKPRTRVVGGVSFTDGVAIVENLSTNARAYLEHLGATITNHAKARPNVDNPLEELSVTELRDLAKDKGVDVAARATKPELVAALATTEG